jgi:hypothetical protein
MTPHEILRTACTRYFSHAEAIISYETERRYSLAQASKCRKRGDDCGYGKWMDQARHYTMESLKETSKAGIVGNSAYANGFNSIDIIARMN